MKRPGCVLFLVLAAGSACSRPAERLTTPAPIVARTVRVQVGEAGNVVRDVPLEEYVQGTIVSEFAPPAGEDAVVARMLQVQAVLGRTYAVANRQRHRAAGFDLCSTTHCQLYEPSRLDTSRWAAAAREAARRTAGVLLWHESGPALPLFHADCGGHTSTPVDAWRGSPRPYLVAAPDDGVTERAHKTWRHEVTAAQLVRALNADTRTRVGTHVTAIKILDRDASGRAKTVALHGQRERLVGGEDLRAVLTRAFGARSVRSTLFDVHREKSLFVFEGRGFGHGVGLCQAGALARIRAGASPEDVLRRYFPQTVTRTLGKAHGSASNRDLLTTY